MVLCKGLILNFILVFCLSGRAFGEMRYVLIDNIGKVNPGKEAGNTAKGDVVATRPYTPQYKPTRAELARYRIFVTDLTDADIVSLKEPLIGTVRVTETITILNSQKQDYVDTFNKNPNFLITKETVKDGNITIEAEWDEQRPIKERKRKVNLSDFSSVLQEEEVEKAVLFSSVSVKPSL